MDKINNLPENIINQIAAGEVIERPASVVKEFLENALDAGAENIEVFVEGAGMKLIKVSDDGQGISSADAVLTIRKHATSKIFSLDDLSNIQSFGFRGEALASIAAVSHFEITSREKNALSGFSIKVKGGGKIQPQEIGRPIGTTVTASNLFFNTPARLKFMKRKSTEENHIFMTVSNYALSFREKSFKLFMDGKQVLEAIPTNLQGRIGQILGKDISSYMVPISFNSGQIQINGAVSLPSMTKPTRENILFFVNHRWVSNPSLSHAVMTAFHTLLPTRRFPVSVLFLSISPEQVDVNVHPTKKEVKFADDRAVYNAVVSSVREGILASPGVNSNPPAFEDQKPATYSFSEDKPFEARENKISYSNDNSFNSSRPATSVSPYQIFRDKPSGDEIRSFFEKDSPSAPRIDPDISLYNFSQLFNTFIVFQSDSEMYIADQHTVHERINYERFMKALNAKNTEIQKLLVPITLEFNPKEALIVKNNIELLAELGLEIAPFGGNTFLFSSVPSDLKDKNPTSLIRDLVDDIASNDNEASKNTDRIEHIREKVTTFLSCRSSVMAGDRLNEPQMRSLIDQMRKANFPFTCPHGRPTIITIPLSELYRKFDRH